MCGMQWGTKGSGEGQLKFPIGVVVNGDEVIVADNQNNRLQVFGLDGSFVRQWGGKAGGGAGQFVQPRGIAVGEGEFVISKCSSDATEIYMPPERVCGSEIRLALSHLGYAQLFMLCTIAMKLITISHASNLIKAAWWVYNKNTLLSTG